MTEHENPFCPPEEPTDEKPLESWKEIAACLKRGVRTVRRWEKSEGLPVRRHVHQARSSVYAYPSELDAWWAMRRPAEEEAPQGRLSRRPARALAFAAMLLLALASAGDGRLLGPARSVVQAQGIAVRQVWAGPRLDSTGGIPPDGRYLSYTDWSTGELALLDLTTGQSRNVTHKGSWNDSAEFASGSAFSPDSKQVAYAWYNKDARFEVRTIALESAAATAPRILCAPAEVSEVLVAAWSPDGKQILALFSRKDKTKQIVLVSAQDGSRRALKTLDWNHPGKMTFSPDSQFIAYDFPQRDATEDRDIFLLATDGTRETRLVDHPANDVLLGWELKGKRILFASNRTGTVSAWAIAVTDGNASQAPELVKQDMGQIRGGPGGAGVWPIGFASKGAYYYGSDIKTEDVFLATFDPGTNALSGHPAPIDESFVRPRYTPDWSADGKYLAYGAQKLSMPVGPATRIILVRSVETGKERELSPNIKFLHLRLSPDMRSILLPGYDSKNRYAVHIVNAQTGDVTGMIPDAYWGEWSRDGKAIFCARNPSEAHKGRCLIARDLESGQDRELYHSLVGVGLSLAVSPDGQRIAFSSFEGKPMAAILKVIPANGGDARELLRLNGANFGGVAWSADGRQLFFVKRSAEGNELWRIPAEGGEPRGLGVTLRAGSQLSVHPDGRRIAFDGGETKSEVWLMENFLPVLKTPK